MKILHPTDFSDGAERARAEAIRLARATGGEVVLLHVLLETPAYGEGLTAAQVLELQEAQRRWAGERLEAVSAETRAAGVAARGLVRTGDPARETVRAADEEGADLIVMGTHGRSGLGRLLLGSVADRVIRQASCPVVTVRETSAAAPRAPAASAGARPQR
ncbi:MAG TPA: universal stress protein [Thermodesulfobacteriota bacterium]|nr:universal stress protein [Thermodesulfobacteriota bacterium]